MTPADASKVLTLIAVYDNRSFEKVTCHAWADALDGLDLADCLDAVKAHFRTSRDWLMPVDIRNHVRAVLRERRSREARDEIEQVPADPEVVAARAAEIRRAVTVIGRMPSAGAE